MGGERLVKVCPECDVNFCLAAAAGGGSNAVLACLDGSDSAQEWLIDESGGIKQRGFALVNRKTGLALCVSGPKAQLSLADYDPLLADERLLWAWSDDGAEKGAGASGKGFAPLRVLGQSDLVADVPWGLAVNGMPVIAHPWKGGDNQRWALQPVGALYTIRSRADPDTALATDPVAPGGAVPVTLHSLDERDPRQLWAVDVLLDGALEIRNALSGVLLRAGAEGGALRAAAAAADAARRPHLRTVWSLGRDEGGRHFALRPVQRLDLNLDAAGGVANGGGAVTLQKWRKGKTWRWLEAADVSYDQMWGFWPKGSKFPVRPV